MIADSRTIVVRRARLTEGGVFLDWLGELTQDGCGIVGCDSIREFLIPRPEDIVAQASKKSISPLEWIRRKLSAVPYITVEVR